MSGLTMKHLNEVLAKIEPTPAGQYYMLVSPESARRNGVKHGQHLPGMDAVVIVTNGFGKLPE